MQGRRSVWSDEQVIERAGRFAPAADEVWRLQRADDPECRWFRRAVHGSADPVRSSMQGTYVLTASGTLLGRINSTRPERILAMLDEALERWDALPPEERAAAAPDDAAPRHRWEDSYPADGLVLERFARDVGDSPADEPREPVNVDAVWFAAREAASWLPDDRRVGARKDVPQPLVERLARFALVDNVRGQTLPYARDEVRGSGLQAEVVGRRGHLVDLVLRGSTRADADGNWEGEADWRPRQPWPRTLRTEITGTATFDEEARRFTAFELVAIGERTGRTTFNGRAKDGADGVHGIGFLLRLAPPGWRVAPTFVNLYGARWVQMPPSTPR